MSAAAPQPAWQPLILAVAPNGAYKTRDDHPALPLTAEEIALDARACRDAGASLLHLHVRDSGGRHSLDPSIYRRTIERVRAEVGDGMVIQVTSEIANVYQTEEQLAMMRALKPESVSLAIREIVPSAAAEPAAAEFLRWVCDRGIIPQFILYSVEDVARYGDLCLRGVVPGGPHLLLFVLGRYTPGQVSAPADLTPFLGVYDQVSPWMVCAFGPMEHACGIVAAGLGGHVRVGFENNLWLKDGTPAPGNAALVQQIAEGAAALGRPLADADTVRRMLRPPAA